jgi:predicted enzyme related to lactoylglutathione lyase
MPGIAELSGVTLECRDPEVLAEFYARLTGWPVVYSSPEYVAIGESRTASWNLSFQRAPGYQPPTWPDPASSMQFHLHLRVNDLDAAQSEAVRWGATVFEEQPNPTGFRVLADPAGHPFCLVASR